MVAQRLTEAAARLLARRIDRRGLLARAAVVGSAVSTAGLDYVLRPGTAYASVCGSGASCASGWTAMCCTINHGVNQCPPGSFAGGWWKADGANLCGGHARYYIDCQAECTHCGCGGGAFCSSHCWNCRSHCADGPCDKRHVCRNLFRYGQCRRDKHCAGPVMCRTITCTPPWKWADCSSASATDNLTRSHSATCLTGWTHIAHRYTEMGSQGSVLGATVHAEREAGAARVQHYQHGRMYWSHATGAHWLTGEILHSYLATHEVHSPLGLPTSDVRTLDDHGHTALFQHGAIYQQHGHPAHPLWGGIYTGWIDRGGHDGPLGYPRTTRRSTPDGGHYALFQHGGIYNGPQTALHAVTGEVATAYDALDRFDGPLGWPTSDVEPLPDRVGSRATFELGEIYQHPAYGANGLWGLVDRAYLRLGAQAGALGYPISGEAAVTGTGGSTGLSVSTVHGSVTLLTGVLSAYGVWGPIYQAWVADGGVGGPVGFPTGDVVTEANGNQQCTFQHGLASYNAASGQTTITTTA